MLAFGAVGLLGRLIAAGAGFVSRKVWKSLPWSAPVVECVNANCYEYSERCFPRVQRAALLAVLCRQML